MMNSNTQIAMPIEYQACVLYFTKIQIYKPVVNIKAVALLPLIVLQCPVPQELQNKFTAAYFCPEFLNWNCHAEVKTLH